MDLKLNGKRALVSGSTAGIGFAIAAGLAREGASVIVNGRTQHRVDEALSKIKLDVRGADVVGIAADLGSKDGVAKATEQLPEVDILINNLGIFEPKAFGEIPDADWMRFFEVNVMSGVRLSRFYFPKMMKQNWGRVVFISSESALNIPQEMIHYGMTKTAQLAVARGLAQLTAGSNVTVNSVLVGPTKSEGVETFVKDLARDQKKTAAEIEANFFKTARPTSLLKRFITTDEVAAMVVFLSSPQGSATNGAAVRVEGGCVQSIV